LCTFNRKGSLLIPANSTDVNLYFEANYHQFALWRYFTFDYEDLCSHQFARNISSYKINKFIPHSWN